MFKRMMAGLTAGLLGAISFAPTANAYRMTEMNTSSYNKEDQTLLIGIWDRNTEQRYFARKGVILDLYTCKGKSFDEIYWAPADADIWLWMIFLVLENIIYRELQGGPDVDWFYDADSDLLGLVTDGRVGTAIKAYPNGTGVDLFTDEARERGLCLGTMPGGVPLIGE